MARGQLKDALWDTQEQGNDLLYKVARDAGDGGLEVTVYDPDDNEATLYSAREAGGTLANPITSDSSTGEYDCFLDPGTYRVEFSRDGVVEDERWVQILDATDVVSRLDSVESSHTGGEFSVEVLGAILNDSGSTAKAANVTAFNAAIALANASGGKVTGAGGGTYYFTAGATLTTLLGAHGMEFDAIGTLEFNTDGDCIVTKGTFKQLENIYAVNRSTSHSATDAVVRIKNCAYGDFKNLYAVCGAAGSPRGVMLEHEYDGSATDGAFLAHLGCWYNRFSNVNAGYLTVGENIGYGLSFEVNSNAVAVVNPTGQTPGTYTGGVNHNTVTGMNVEGKARGINLDRASGNVFVGGQMLGSAKQVYGRNSSSSNKFDTVKWNQADTQLADLDSSCQDNEWRNPVIFPTTMALGAPGDRFKFDSVVLAVGGGAPAVAFATNWDNAAGFEQATYYREGQTVRLTGMLTKAVAAITNGEVMFTLPALMRPLGLLDFTVGTTIGGVNGSGRLRVNSSGQVIWLAGDAAIGDMIELTASFRAYA